jgi:hypothetical protein
MWFAKINKAHNQYQGKNGNFRNTYIIHEGAFEFQFYDSNNSEHYKL